MSSLTNSSKKGIVKGASILRWFSILLTSVFISFNAKAQCPAGFVVDGNPCDWNNAPAGARIGDPFGTGVLDNQFTQGSKDFFLAADLRWVIGQTKEKNDIANGAAFLDGCILRFAGDRSSNNGDAQIGFWFYINGTGPVVQPDGTQNFAPEHFYDPVTGIGDLLIIANFTNGGNVATVEIYKWVGTGGNVPNTGGALNTTNLVGTAAQNNAQTYPIPNGWVFGSPNYETNEFFEGQVNLCDYSTGNPLCFSTFLLEARSSQSITASLDDFVGGPFVSGPSVPTVTPGARCGPGTVDLSATCSAAGSTPRWWADASGGSPLFTGTNFTTPSLTQTTTFYVSCFNASTQCESNRVPVIATVNANPTANAGPDQAKCQTPPSGPTSFTMAGTASNGTTSWTQVSSTGTANASIVSPGSLTTVVNVSGIGTVTLRLTTTSNTTPSCGTATDDVVLTVNANPTANAGPDQIKCQTPPSGPTSFTMAGVAANGTTVWTQISQTGTANAAITTPGSLTTNVDVSGIGTVTLRLTTTSNTSPSCGTAIDDVVLTVNANPTANAGPDQIKCQTPPSGPTSFTMAGVAANGTTAWMQISSTGTANSVISSPGSLTTNVDVSGIGTVTLRLTTTSNTSPSCGSATDDVVLTVNAIPTANAGPDQIKCQTPPSGPTSFTMAGTGVNGTFLWTQVGSTGTASAAIANPTSLTTTVNVSGIGTVTLRLTTTSNATPPCGTAFDEVTLTVNANPTANAGPDQTKCQTPPSGPTSFTLAATASNGTIAWTQIASTGTANATIVDPQSLTTNVNVSGIGTVTLRLTTTSNTSPSCGTATDDVVLTVTLNPTANAGPDQTKCQTPPLGPTSFTMAGSATAGTIAWTQIASTGTASASIVDPASLTTNVNVSGIGTVTLRLTSTSNSVPSCGSATDDVILTVNANPAANAGPDQTKCQTPPAGPTSFTMAGTGANGTFLWTQVGSSGTASAAIANPTSLTTNVNVSGIGTVTLRLTTTSNTTPSCGIVSDEVTLTVTANPIANAGPDQTKCQTPPSGPTSFTMAGTATNGTIAWTQISSTGTANAVITSPGSLTTNVDVSGIGTVTLRLTTTSDAIPSCGTATDDVVLTVIPNPTAAAGADQAKCQTPVTTAFTVDGTGTNGTPSWTQIASTGTANASIVTPGAFSTVVNVSGLGTVTLRLTVTSNSNPSCGTATDDLVLTVNANPEVQLGPLEVCANECLDLISPQPGTFAGQFVTFDVLRSVFQFCAPAIAGPYPITFTAQSPLGCITNAPIDIIVLICNPEFHCTLTQGAYGNAGGNDCDGVNGSFPTPVLINNLLGATGITVGRPGRSVIIPPGSANALIAILPGGGPSKVLAAGNCNITAQGNPSCLPLKNGRINNALLAQTITLSLNVRLNAGSLSNFVLVQDKYLVTQARNGCGEDAITVSCADDSSAIQSWSLDQSVIDYLAAPGGYPPTVAGLLDLANDVLGGILVPGTGGVPSFSAISGVADAINNAFDHCRTFVGWFDCAKNCENLAEPCETVLTKLVLPTKPTLLAPVNSNTVEQAKVDKAGISKNGIVTELNVSAFPNPFTDRVRFVIASPVSGEASLEIFNHLGQQINVAYKGHIVGGRNQTIDYKIPGSITTSLFYKLRIGDKMVTGRLVRLE